MKVTTKQGNKLGKQTAIYEVNPGDNLQAAVGLYGDVIVFGLYLEAFKLKCHSKARSKMTDSKNKAGEIVSAGLTGDAAAKEMVGFKPSLGKVKKSAVDKIKDEITKGNLSKEQAGDLVKTLRDLLASAK